MRLKNYLFIFCGFFTLVLFSCQKGQHLSKDDTPGQPEIISIEVARQVAEGFALKNFHKNNTLNGKSAIPSQVLLASEERIGTEANPYFYVFNFKENGGFVIVSAEQKAHPILAYSDEGKFVKENAPEGILSWISATKSNIDNVRKTKSDKAVLAKGEWQVAASKYKITPMLKPPPDDPGCRIFDTIWYNIGPLLQTTWDQGCGYNDYCPAGSEWFLCYHCPTGCVATAMGQVMRYWQTPSTYNWSTMPNSNGNADIATLMANIGTAVNMSYTSLSSGAFANSIVPAFQNTFGYSSASLINYGSTSYNSLIYEIANFQRPVLLLGVDGNAGGHCWVCDGTLQQGSYWCDESNIQVGVQFDLFHMNWGWGGQCNGWFVYDNWAPGNGNNFQYYRQAVINIHP